MIRPLMLIPLLLGACSTDGVDLVQTSSDQNPSFFVNVDPAEGFVPGCLAVAKGRTVRWENLSPLVPANVTSVEEPPELYSPNLQGSYVTWSHTFDQPGLYEYYDTNTGDPGRRIVDAYYGTVTFVGVSPTTQRGPAR